MTKNRAYRGITVVLWPFIADKNKTNHCWAHRSSLKQEVPCQRAFQDLQHRSADIYGTEGSGGSCLELLRMLARQSQNLIKTIHTAAGSAALWSSTCLTCTRPWVRFSVLPKTKEGGGGPRERESGRGVVLHVPLVYWWRLLIHWWSCDFRSRLGF